MARRLLLLGLLLLAFAALAQLPATADHDFPQQVTDLINAARAREGLPPFRLEPRLVNAAQGHSDDMATRARLDHTGSDGSSPWDRIKRAGYDWVAASECIAGGQSTAEWVVADWLNSPPHRRILMGEYRDIGIGYAYSDAGLQHYWTADVGSENATPTRAPTNPATPTLVPTRPATPISSATPSPTVTPASSSPPLSTPTRSVTVTGRYVIRLMILSKHPARTPAPPGGTPLLATVAPYP